jgi:NhaP-type Na+/H+ or K+/H+ antiporter
MDNGLSRLLNGEELSIGSGDIAWTLTKFAFISIFSVLIGVGFGLISSFICKNVPTLKIHPAREVFLILLVAYLAYVVSEMLFLSGIMTIFCCGMTMSYYTLYNMSSKSRKGSQLAVETIGHAAEAFLFAYLGLSLFSISENQISIQFSFFVLFATFIARAIAIVIPYLCVYKLTDKLDMNQLLVIWFSGLVKGAIAFGLSAQIPGSLSSKRSYLISTTISIVLLSTIIIGGLMSFFANRVGLSKEDQMIKRMYASIGRDTDKKNIANGMLSHNETENQVEEINDSMLLLTLIFTPISFISNMIFSIYN